MALLTAGYFHATYFPSRYWQTGNQYWPEYGTAAAAVAEPTTLSFKRKRKPRRLWLPIVKRYLELKLR